MIPLFDCCGDILSDNNCSDGKSAAQAFAQEEDIRRHVFVVGAEHLSRPANAGLNFIEDEQYIMPIRNFPQTFQITGWRHIYTAFALNRLYDNCGSFLINASFDSLATPEFNELASRSITAQTALDTVPDL